MSDPIDISKLPTFMLREIVAGETKLQPEEVKPCPTKHQSESTLRDSHPSGSNAAPQGSNPPAGAAGVIVSLGDLWAGACKVCGERGEWGIATQRGSEGCNEATKSGEVYCREHLPIATPAPQPQGGTGTPEVEAAAIYCDLMAPEESEEQYAYMVPLETAKAIETQRNEARAALAAALAEVEAARVVVESQNTEIKAGMSAMVQFDKERATLRAELEQTRRERDALQQGAGNAIRLLAETSQALTAAEERANGAERKSKGFYAAFCEAMSLLEDQDCTPENCQLEAGIKSLIASRDTAQRERDGAMKDTARLDWLFGLVFNKGTDGIGDLLWTAAGEDSEDIVFDRAAIDAGMKNEALAAKTTEGGA